MTKKVKKIKEPKLYKLDVACGQNKPEGFIGIDIAKCKGVDIVHDLEKYPWPIKSDSVDEIHCSHYIEHTKDLLRWFDELYRIMKVGAKATIIAPYYNNMRCWQDPTHTRAISEATFLYANAEWRKNNKLDHYPISCDFDFTYGYALDPQWANRSEEARNFAIKHNTNVVSDIHCILTKRPLVK